jgi:hypothetical protein
MAGNQQIEEALITQILLIGLPASFDHVRSIANAMPISELNRNRIESLLSAEWSQKSLIERNQVNFNRANTSYYSRISNENVKCYKCGRLGHCQDRCFLGGNSQINSSGKSRYEAATTCLKVNVENIKDEHGKQQRKTSGWIIDSAATNHITNDINDFENFEPINETLQWGTNSECDVKGQGIVKFGCNVGRNKNWVSLGKTLYAPKFQYKVFSTSDATTKGWRFLNTKNAITATHNHKVNFIASRKPNGFYYGNFEVTNDFEERRKAKVRRLNELYDIFN